MLVTTLGKVQDGSDAVVFIENRFKRLMLMFEQMLSMPYTMLC
jgi:hypothetical protein